MGKSPIVDKPRSNVVVAPSSARKKMPGKIEYREVDKSLTSQS